MAKGYLQVPHELLRSGLDPILLRVYLVIASFADAGTRNECTAARETIAAAAGCSPASVKRAIPDLERMLMVSVRERRGQSSVITPVRPRDVNLTEIGAGSGHTDPQRRQKKEDGKKKTYQRRLPREAVARCQASS